MPARRQVEIGGRKTGTRGALATALCYELVVLAGTFAALGLMWAYLGTSHVPVRQLTVSVQDLAVQQTNFSTTSGRQLFVGSAQPLTDVTSPCSLRPPPCRQAPPADIYQLTP